MKKGKKKKKNSKTMTEELMQSNEIVSHKRKTKCVVRPKEYSDYDLSVMNTEVTSNQSLIKIYKCDICENSFERDSALNKHMKKAHILNKDTSIISLNPEDTLLLKTFKKKMENKKKMKKASKASIQLKTAMLPLGTKKHKWHTVVNEPHNEQLENHIAVIPTKINKSNVSLKSFESEYFTQNTHKVKDLNKRNVVTTSKIKKSVETTMNTLNSPENEKECKLLLKTPVKEPKNNKNNLIKYQKTTTILKKCDEHKGCMKRNPAGHTKGTNSYKCNVCKNTFDINEQKTMLNNECNICSKSFSSRSALSRHCKLHTGGRPYKCDICGKSFKQKWNLTVHCRLHTDERPYTCDVCYRSFNEKGTLTAHYRLHTGERPYTCDICGKTFVLKCALTVHYRLHTGERPFTCDVCCRSFRRKGSLTVHYRLHTGERPFTCDVCCRSFRRKGSLTAHYRLHTGERPYTCDICGKTFVLKCALTVHYRLHTGERPFTCDVCCKSFREKGSLTVHYRLHTGERPFTCDVCCRSFNEKGTLTAHYRLHTGERPYTCDVCGKTFVKAYTLTVHYRLHTGERPYKCGLCQMSFVGSGGLTRHTRSKHDRCL